MGVVCGCPKIWFRKIGNYGIENESALNAVVALKGEAGAIAMILWLWRGERKLPLTVYAGWMFQSLQP